MVCMHYEPAVESWITLVYTGLLIGGLCFLLGIFFQATYQLITYGDGKWESLKAVEVQESMEEIGRTVLAGRSLSIWLKVEGK